MRERQALNIFQTEKDLLRLRSQSHSAHCENIDEEVFSVFKEKYSNAICAALNRLWPEDVKLEEQRSAKRWENVGARGDQKYAEEF